MEQREKGHGNNGFILGVIIGIVLTLLFTTKKGRKVLKVLSEEGFQKFSELEGLLDPQKKETGVSVAQALREEDEDLVEEAYPDPEHEKNMGTEKKIIVTPRRFFRRTPKRAN